MLTPISLIAPPPKLSPADKESTMVIDIFGLGAHVEMILAAYLQPYPEGLYLPDQQSPVMLVGETYHQIVKNEHISFELTNTPLVKLSKTSGIYDARDKLVVTAHQMHMLSSTPNVPVKGMAIVEGYIKRIVNSNGHWPHGHNVEDTEDLLQADLLPQWVHNPEDAFIKEPVAQKKAIAKRLVLDKLIDAIEATMCEMRNQLVEFIGRDKWVMHFVKQSKTHKYDILIEKTINYKVYDWDRRMESGLWSLDDQLPAHPINDLDEKTQILQQTLADMAADSRRNQSPFGQIDLLLASNRR